MTLEEVVARQLCDSLQVRNKFSTDVALLDGIDLASSPGTTLRNPGVLFDRDMSSDSHIKPFYHIQNLDNVGCFPSQSDAERLVDAFTSSRLDYCN